MVRLAPGGGVTPGLRRDRLLGVLGVLGFQGAGAEAFQWLRLVIRHLRDRLVKKRSSRMSSGMCSQGAQLEEVKGDTCTPVMICDWFKVL